VSRYSVRLALYIMSSRSEDMDSFTDHMMEHLVELNDDADMGGSLSTGLFDVWVTVEAGSATEAALAGTTIIRTAAHAAGGYTQDWPQANEWPAWLRERAIEAHEVERPELVYA